jgi:hypothetical protein
MRTRTLYRSRQNAEFAKVFKKVEENLVKGKKQYSII